MYFILPYTTNFAAIIDWSRCRIYHLTVVLFHACAVHAISVVLKRHEFIVNVIRPLPFM